MRRTTLYLLINPVDGISVTVVPDDGETLTRRFATLLGAYEYVHQYTVNSYQRTFTLVVTEQTPIPEPVLSLEG